MGKKKKKKKKRALIKIITSTGSQSPIQERIKVNEPDEKSKNIILIDKPLKTKIKPLATSRERKIERDYSSKNTDNHRRRHVSKSPSCLSYSNHKSRYDRSEHYYHERSQYHTRTYDYKQPYRYQQHQHPYEQPQR
jgi:hypothetical protein